MFSNMLCLFQLQFIFSCLEDPMKRWRMPKVSGKYIPPINNHYKNIIEENKKIDEELGQEEEW